MSKYRVLEECADILDALGPEGSSGEREQALRTETRAVAEAAQALRRLASPEVRQELDEFQASLDQLDGIGEKSPGDHARDELRKFASNVGEERLTLKIAHDRDFLNSFDEDYWARCFVDLFFRSDCQEKYRQHTPQLGGQKWIRVLLKRADFRGWAMSKEFAAVVANILLRREQMRAVHRYVTYNKTFHKHLLHYNTLTSTDFVAAALASGDCNSVRDLMRKQGVEFKVKVVLKSMEIALRDVEGTDAERTTFRFKFAAMRIWNGCSFLFFTLNPHDIHSPLLIVFADADNKHVERVSLDWEDEEMRAYYARAKAENPLRFHEFAVAHPAAAALCVHMTFRSTIELLFNCAPPANVKPESQHADGFPCRCEPGILNYIAGYLGIVEPQMRWTEHLHMLIQLLGFSHPRDFFQGGQFIETFRAVWSFVASIIFESQEAFAAYLGTTSAMESLQQSVLVEITPKQGDMIGADRAAASINAQVQGRGLTQRPVVSTALHHGFDKFTPQIYGDRGCANR